MTGRTAHVADTGSEPKRSDGFTAHCQLSPRFLLSNALGVSDTNYLEISHAEPLAFFYPKEAAKSLRERFENPERGEPR